MCHELHTYSVFLRFCTSVFFPFVLLSCFYPIMKSQNNEFPGHAQSSSSLGVDHIPLSDVPDPVERRCTVGLFTDDGICTCHRGIALSECRASNCKRKRLEGCHASGVGLQRKKQCRDTRLEGAPSGTDDEQHLIREVDQVSVSSNTVPQAGTNVHVASITPSVNRSDAPFIPVVIDNDATIESFSHGDTQMPGRSVMLDFATGLIRHEVNVEPDGTEWANDIVHEIGGNQSFKPASGASVRGSRKRKQPEVTGYLGATPMRRPCRYATKRPLPASSLRPSQPSATGPQSTGDQQPCDQRPSQRRRRRAGHLPSGTPSSKTPQAPLSTTYPLHQHGTAVTSHGFVTHDTDCRATGSCTFFVIVHMICNSLIRALTFVVRHRFRPIYWNILECADTADHFLARKYSTSICDIQFINISVSYRFVTVAHLLNLMPFHIMTLLTMFFLIFVQSFFKVRHKNIAHLVLAIAYAHIVMHSSGMRRGLLAPQGVQAPYIIDAVWGIVQGLIELLDNHNALVQLFRSARDKLLETDVPDFKIRLFSVVGSGRHELPTADEIGAIVFEEGSGTSTDFDVVIQRHSEEPERINKLHPTYMSLHFPLLFIFGEQGYHIDLKLLDTPGLLSEGGKRMSMDAYYAYLLHDRSARDKLLETDVPDFKIRLFSVVGSGRHELPTADEIGAIVFEEGSGTSTDFDVVIQRHSEEPERINKLHPTYMSLHFPLLFIFGEQGYHIDLKLLDTPGVLSEGGKRMSMDAYYAYLLHDRQMAERNMDIPTPAATGSSTPSDTHGVQQSKDKGKGILVEEDIVDIMNLKSSDMNKPLELKVYRKWASRNVPDPNPTGLCFILLGKQHGHLDRHLFKVNSMKATFNHLPLQGGAIQANVQLWDVKQFDAKLQLDTCYQIQAYGCKRTDKWQRTLENDITLLFGKYTQVTEIQDAGFPKHYFNFAAYNQVGQRADSRDSILTDYIGILRDVGNIRESGDSMTNRISRRNIEIQNLNGNTITLTLWNEQAIGFPVNLSREIEQPVIIAVSSCWAKRFGGGIQLSATPATCYYLNPEIAETDHIRALYEEYMGPLPPLLPPPTEPDIQELEMPQRYMSIRDLLEVRPETNVLRPFVIDAVITNIDETQGCYNFKATLADDTGSIVVTCFSPEANSLLLPVTEMLSYADRDPYILPPLIKDLEHTEHVFTIHIAPGSRRGNTKFILDHAADAPQPTSPHTLTPVEQMRLPTHVLEQPSEDVVTEMPITQITPPPETDDSAEKKDSNTEGPSKTVRKQLFTEPEVHQTQTTITENEPASTAVPQETPTTTEDQPATTSVAQETPADPEDKTVTQASKKPKYE
ncbi:nucleic acid-binding, OB-fold protein [Artemisia annua]|uniref:Nucleic acid-binding, OB-fold protein n=1 Tax=Artemisia annua TaxID=35608 RepID=A0A2U1NIW3_ARTAN|nr:nucleic acid-binding, OB-fold protein [Artemisia annua]